MNSFTYNPIFWIFVSYAVGQIVADYLLNKQKVDWFENQNYLSDRHTKLLGILLLGWLIRHTFMGWFNKKLKLKPSASNDDLMTLKNEMTSAEAGHLVAFYFLLIVNLAFILYDLEWWYIVLFFLINVVFNMYLVLLQQYNKRRIDRLIKKY